MSDTPALLHQHVSMLPASTIGFTDRGQIAKHKFADIVVFDPKTVGTRADFRQPDLPPTGIEQVFINGGHVVKSGTYDKNAFAGKVLRR